MRDYHHFDFEPSTYRTGSTQPPKNYGSIIAVLLVLVIALCGIISILSVVNIRLKREVRAAEKQQSLSIIHSKTTDEAMLPMDGISADSSVAFPVGFSGEDVSTLYQLYYGLPGGILISSSEQACVEPGDILLRIDGIRILSGKALTDQLADLLPGDTVQAEFYRSGTEFTVTLTIEETNTSNG